MLLSRTSTCKRCPFFSAGQFDNRHRGAATSKPTWLRVPAMRGRQKPGAESHPNAGPLRGPETVAAASVLLEVGSTRRGRGTIHRLRRHCSKLKFRLCLFCGAVDSPKSASAGVGFQKDSLRSLLPLAAFLTVQGYRPAYSPNAQRRGTIRPLMDWPG